MAATGSHPRLRSVCPGPNGALGLKTALLTLALLFGCTGGNGSQYHFSAQLPGAAPYYKELETQTRYASVFHQFQRVVKVHAVRFNPGLFSAYTHFVGAYTRPGGSDFLSSLEARKAHILVSVFAPSPGDMDLDNPRLWALSATGAGATDPVPVERVQRVQEKKRLSLEFPFVSAWSQEFLMTFPIEDVSQIHFKSPTVVLSLNWSP